MAPRLDLVGFVMARSFDSYCLLGVEIPAGSRGAPHVEVDLGGFRLAWDTVDTVRSFDPGWSPPSGGHGVSLAFDCGDPAGVDATHAGVVAAGHASHLEPWDDIWGQRHAVVHDPDGNSVDLFAALS